MGSQAHQDTAMMEPLALSDQDMGLPLQDSLGPELLKLLDDLGGEDGWCAGGQAPVGAALDTAGLDRSDIFMDDATGIPMPQDPQRPIRMEQRPIKAEQHKQATVGFSLPPSVHRQHPLDQSHSGSYSELMPPQSAFQQQPAMPPTPPIPANRPMTQKPRSIRRARSGLPAHLQSRSSSEPQEVLRRANSGGEIQETQRQASKQVLSTSPKSTSTIFRPFSPLAAVEVLAEDAAMAANGRRIKRRGSGRSGKSGEVELASLKASTEGTEHVSHLLESQKQAYEAKLEDSGTRVSDLARQLVRLQMEKQVLEQTLQQVLEQPISKNSSPTTSQQDAVRKEDKKSPEREQGPHKSVPRLFNPAEDYDDGSVLVVTLSEKTITLTAKEVTSMPWQQFVRLMKRYITQIGALLPEAEAQPKSAAAQRAEQLGREAMYIGSCLAAGIPRHTRTLYCLKLQESGPEQSRAPPQLWMAIMLQMNLSASQRQEVLRRRKAFLMAMAEILRRRRAIIAGLQTLPHPDPSVAGLSNNFLRVSELVDRMKNNLDKDHFLVRRFIGGIVHHVWTPLQFARALVQSFPWMPDPVCIANCVAEQAREPTAEELLSNRTSSLASTSTASLASLFSNGSKPDSPMTRDLSVLMPWKTAGPVGQPDGQHGQKPQSSKDGNRQGFGVMQHRPAGPFGQVCMQPEGQPSGQHGQGHRVPVLFGQMAGPPEQAGQRNGQYRQMAPPPSGSFGQMPGQPEPGTPTRSQGGMILSASAPQL